MHVGDNIYIHVYIYKRNNIKVLTGSYFSAVLLVSFPSGICRLLLCRELLIKVFTIDKSPNVPFIFKIQRGEKRTPVFKKKCFVK